MAPNPYDWIEKSLETIHRADWYRSVQPLAGRPGPVVMVEGQPLINFASNDYLGLAGDERLAQAAIAATQALGTGTTGSRLLSGHRDLHRDLEKAIARLKQTEDAVVFSSGYLANVGAIAALVGARDLILSDQYNHSSIRSGARLSGATVLDYRHNSLDDLADLLQQHRSQHRRCLIVTDTVFSMDGDLCPLPGILALAETHEAMVLVDEAHGTGVMGDRGAGGVEHLGCSGRSLIQMGTLSKALGSLGGYVAGSAPLVDYLRNRAATWIYTTGLTPADTGAAIAALDLVEREPQRRQRLWQNVAFLQQAIADLAAQERSPFQLLPSESPILCLQVADPATAIAFSQALRRQGLWVSAVRPPTVPTSRLRLTVMATHEPAHLEKLVFALGHL